MNSGEDIGTTILNISFKSEVTSPATSETENLNGDAGLHICEEIVSLALE